MLRACRTPLQLEPRGVWRRFLGRWSRFRHAINAQALRRPQRHGIMQHFLHGALGISSRLLHSFTWRFSSGIMAGADRFHSVENRVPGPPAPAHAARPAPTTHCTRAPTHLSTGTGDFSCPALCSNACTRVARAYPLFSHTSGSASPPGDQPNLESPSLNALGVQG